MKPGSIFFFLFLYQLGKTLLRQSGTTVQESTKITIRLPRGLSHSSTGKHTIIQQSTDKKAFKMQFHELIVNFNIQAYYCHVLFFFP